MRIILFMIAAIILSSLVFSIGYSDNLIVLGNGHAPIYMSNSDSGRFDLDNDGNADYYVKAHYTGNSHQKLKVDYKIQDECVDLGPKDASDMGGDTFDDVTITNSWFNSKKNDENKLINLAVFPDNFVPSNLPASENGDNVIQSNGKTSSFKHLDSISELGDQSGWVGTIFVNAPEGEYALWTLHPSGGYGGCDGLSGFGIPIIIAD